MSPFGDIKDPSLGYKEGVLAAMKSFTNEKIIRFPGSDKSSKRTGLGNSTAWASAPEIAPESST